MNTNDNTTQGSETAMKCRKALVAIALGAGTLVPAATFAATTASAAPPRMVAVQQFHQTSRLTGVTATVPNMFVRDCSYITRRCTGWYQTNGSYNWSVPSSYTTRWVWRWI